MIPSILTPRTARMAAQKAIQRRGMAGGFNPTMKVKKNKFMEEWNGKREITERSFAVESDSAPTLIFYVLVIPYGAYTWSRSEFLSKGDRRYKELV